MRTRSKSDHSDHAHDKSPLIGSGGIAHRPRTISRLTLAIWIFFAVNGGPYGIEQAVQSSSPLVALVALLVIPLAWCYPIAVVTIELSVAYMDSEGGLIDWTRHAFGDRCAKLVAFQYLLANFCDNSCYPILCASYICGLLNVDEAAYFWLPRAIAAVVVFKATCLNLMGLDIAGTAAWVLFVFIMAPVVLLTVFTLPYLHPPDWFHAPPDFLYSTDWTTMFALIFWVYSGWEDMGNLADAVNNPAKSFPTAIFLAIALVTVGTIAPTMLSVSVQPDVSQWSDGYFETIAEQVGNRFLALAVGLGGALGLFSNFLAQQLVSSQALHFTSVQGWTPEVFSRTRGDFTPYVSIIFCGSICLLIGVSGSFTFLAELWTLLYCMTMLWIFAAFIKLRLLFPISSKPQSDRAKDADVSSSIRAAYGATDAELQSIANGDLQSAPSSGLDRPYVAGGDSLVAAILLILPPSSLVLLNLYFFVNKYL
eukprot:g78221.t1